MTTTDRRPSITFSVPTRESATVKAARLLAQFRVRVRLAGPGFCSAVVNGDTGTYQVGCSRSRWHCSCASYGASCSHIRAVQAIVDLSGDPPGPSAVLRQPDQRVSVNATSSFPGQGRRGRVIPQPSGART